MTGKLKSLLIVLICFLALTTAKGVFAVYPVVKKRHLSLSIFVFIIVSSFLIFTPTKAYGATPVFYSVGQNTTDHKTGTPTVTVSGTTATFSVAQTATNMGVGDLVTYIGGTCYISGKTSTTVWSCTNATGGTPTAVTNASVTSIAHAFNSLSAAEAGAPTLLGNSDLTAIDVQLNFPCYYDTGADTTAVTVDGYTTDSTRYIKIYTPNNIATEVNQSQRHSGKWDDGKYSLNVANNSAIIISDQYVSLEGLQVGKSSSSGSFQKVISIASIDTGGSGIWLSSLICRQAGNASYQEPGINVLDVDATVYIWNTIVYGLGSYNGASNAALLVSSGMVYAYSSTFIGNNHGINNLGGTVIAKNIYAYRFLSQDAYGGIITKTNCASSDATGSAGLQNIALNIVNFTNITSGLEDYHLTTSSALKDVGADTSGDVAPMNFTTDIDGEWRPIGAIWDIGADEAEPKKVFFSVGQSASNLMTGTPNVTITSGVATFSVAQTGNIGVGDVVVAGGNSYYISGKTSTTIWNVTTATGGVPADLASTVVTSIGRVYTSLASAEAGAPTLLGTSDLVTANVQLNFTCYYDSGADTTAVTVDGYTTGENNYIKIYTPNNIINEANQSQRHSGKWDDGKYRLEDSDVFLRIDIREDFVMVEGLQILVDYQYTIGNRGIEIQTQNPGSIITISENIIRATLTGPSDGSYGIRTIDSDPDYRIFNNIIYDFSVDGKNNAGIVISNNGAPKVYNNTIYNCDLGVMGNVNMLLLNNVADTASSSYLCVDGCTMNSGSDYNISSDGTAPGTNSKLNTTVEFVDATNNDFRLAETDTAARNSGVDLSTDSSYSFTVDIQGTAHGAAWDIGADEVPVDFVSSVMQSGGDYATLSAWEDAVESDLTLSTTRVFSGTLTGALAENATVTLYRSAVSTGITATVVAKSTVNGQILVDNITNSTTPLVAQANDQWYLDASNYFTISGTGDQLGASPRAVAKIDGAWTVADTTSINVNEWSTDIDNYIKIYTTDLARHDGKWSVNSYRLESANTVVSLNEEYTTLEGIQIRVLDSNWPSGINIGIDNKDSNISVQNNLVRGDYVTVNYGYGIAAYTSRSSNVNIANNIIYNFYAGAGGDTCVYVIESDGSKKNWKVYNNTIYNCDGGINSASGVQTIAINNIVANTINPYGSNFHTLSTNNATDISDTLPGALGSVIQNATFNFVSTTPGFEDFHLQETSTDVINAGADLSSDPYINIATDIDGASRDASIGAFDIGADETATKIFRSVGPSATAALATGASNGMMIAGSVATFASTDLPTNVGVGDAIQYDSDNNSTIDAVIFIHARTDARNFTVKKSDGSSVADMAIADLNWSLFRAYTSLSGAESGNENDSLDDAIEDFDNWDGTGDYTDTDEVGKDLVSANEQWNIAAYANGTTADVSKLTIGGWNTSAQNYLNIYTPIYSNEVGVTQRHSGKWDDGRYTMAVNHSEYSYSFIIVYNSFVNIEGIQLKVVSSAYEHNGIMVVSGNSNGLINISKNIIKTTYTGTAGGSAIISHSTNFATINITNNILYGAGVSGTYGGPERIYNNTVYNAPISGNGNDVAMNNIVQGSSSGFNGTFDSSSDFNISDISGDAPNTTFLGGYNTVEFIDEANNDFHLAQTDTSARGAGANLSADANLPFSTDIDGQLRNATGTGWDIGADEGTVEFAPTVMETGGDYSTLASWEAGVQTDLVADSTRVFAHSGVTGAIADDASVTGQTSGATATVVHVTASSSQILLENISGTFESGETVQVDGSNYVVLSDNGNPASAVAKIDGAWSGADTTAVTIDGWETGVDNYIRIYTMEEARHQGDWNNTKYRIIQSGSNMGIYLRENNAKLDGLQVEFAGNSDAKSGIVISNSISINKIVVSNNIVKGSNSIGINNTGVAIAYTTDNHDLIIYNNIVYGFSGNGIRVDGQEGAENIYLSNNTIYDNVVAGVYSVRSNHILNNNLSFGNGEDYHISFGSFSNNSSHNISSDSTAPGINSKTGTTVQFVDADNDDFHLASNDTAAIDAGIDFSENTWIPASAGMTTDIDGDSRPAGSSWDIGADEAPVKIFRSVGPSNTSTLATDESHANNITITSGTATFSTALADNIGVGDVILYDSNSDDSLTSADSIAFIKSRTDSAHYLLQTETGAIPADLAINDTYAIYRAYTSLANAEAGTKNTSIPISFTGGNRDLVTNNEQWNIACYANGTTADTTAVMINGWTTGVQNFIKIYTPVNSSEVGVTQRHGGKWDEEKYKMELTATASWQRAIRVADGWTRIDGLQIKAIGSDYTDTQGINLSPDEDSTAVYVSNNIVAGVFSGTNSSSIGIRVEYFVSAGSRAAYVWNNIVYGFVNGSSGTGIYGCHTGWNSCLVYNNTVFGNYYGISLSTSIAFVKNTISYNNTDNYAGGVNVANSTNNLSGPSQTDAPGTNPINGATVQFADETSKDFHLALSDTVARNAGVDLSKDMNLAFQDDIDGDHRDMNWSIGADDGPKTTLQNSAPDPTESPNLDINNGLVGYWSFNGDAISGSTAKDLSGNNNNGTIVGAEPTIGKRGQGMSFDGADNRVTTKDDIIKQNTITVCAWINIPNYMQHTATIVGDEDFLFSVNVANNPFERLALSSNYGTDTVVSETHSLVFDKWQNVCAVRLSNGDVTFYIDGEQSGAANQNSGTPTDSYNYIPAIGARYDGGYPFKGNIDETRIYNRALSLDEIKHLSQMGEDEFQTTQTDKLTNGLVGMWSFDAADVNTTTNIAYDRSGSGNDGTISGATPAIGKKGQGMRFNGSSDYVEKISPTNIPATNSPITISLWAKSNVANGGGRLIDIYDSSAYKNITFGISPYGSRSVLRVAGYSDRTLVSTSASPTDDTFPADAWIYYVYTFDGTTHRIYRDAELDNSSNTLPDIGNPNRIGIGRREIASSGTYFNGNIDEVRIYNRALSVDEVGDLYNLGKVEINQ